MLLDDVRSSIDYYRNQPGSAQLHRVVVTGGSAQLPGLPERLSALVGVPVEPAYMHDLLRIGDIGFAPDELPRLEPYLPAPVGLALGGANIGTVIDLSPKRHRATSKTRGGMNQKAIVAAAVGIVLLAGATYKAHGDQSSAHKKSVEAQAAVKKLQSELFFQQQTAAGRRCASAAALKADVKTVLAPGRGLGPGRRAHPHEPARGRVPLVVLGHAHDPGRRDAAAAGDTRRRTRPPPRAGTATTPVTPTVNPNDLCAGLDRAGGHRCHQRVGA